MAGEDAWTVADELFLKNNFEKISSPSIGNVRLDKINLDDAEKKVTEAFDMGEIDDATYNYQMRLINDLREAKQHLIDFEKARKENALPESKTRR